MSQMTVCSRLGIVPPGASLVPDHPLCRTQGHQGLRWTEDTELLSATGTRTRIVAAQCTDCGRHQERVRVVYPPSRTTTVTSPTLGPSDAGERTRAQRRTMTDLDLDATAAQIEEATEFLVTYGPDPRIWCTSCENDTRLVTHVDGALWPTDVEQVLRRHVCGPPASPWANEQGGRAAS